MSGCRVARASGKARMARRWHIAALLAWLLAWLLVAQPTLAQAPSAWSEPVDIAAPASEGKDLYGVLLCDSDQVLHVLWGKGYDGGAAIYYRSDLGGELSPPIDVAVTDRPLALALSAAISNVDDTLHVVWLSAWVKGDVFYASAPVAQAQSVRAWSEPVVLIPAVDNVQIVADAAGALHLVYSLSDSEGLWNALYHTASRDAGLSWEQPQLIYEVLASVPSTLRAAVAIDGAGRMHVGVTRRSQEYGVDSELGYLRSLDGGRSWDPYLTVLTQTVSTPNMDTITPYTFGADEVHLTWHDPRRMHMWSSDGGETWSSPILIEPLGAGFGSANVLVRDSAGTLRAVVSAKGAVQSASFDGFRWSAPEWIDDRDIDPHGQSMVVCQGDQLHLVYDDRHPDDSTVWYAHRTLNTPHLAQRVAPTRDEQAGDGAVEGPVAQAPVVQPTAAPLAHSAGLGLPEPEAELVYSARLSLNPMVLAMASVSVLLAAAVLLVRRR